ncbi:hypothetical protein QFC22_006324 [Naganishia vaughanmartiniae]|uniref:Uncharacterized protein n=1 Tax=Naganishia vaughanmartiniae TaxID=1424756 RepID=A0ACC2WKG7_9TREE|nr:hypothetical protein QFC22_006324 [Naganishia vaughanmartiniae]
MAAPLYTTSSGRLFHAGLILIPLVGLPARGKTHIARSLERYLRWLGVKTRVYSLGDYRRKVLGGANTVPDDYFTIDAKSEETIKLRNKIKDGIEDQVWDFFERQGGQVVIYDANNGDKKSRKELLERFEARGVHVIFLESMCDKDDIIEANIRSVKLSSPDVSLFLSRSICTSPDLVPPQYMQWDPEKAVADYWKRIKQQEAQYQEVTPDEGPFIKIMNVGEKIVVNRIEGYLQTRCCFYLMNIHNRHRTIYFARASCSLLCLPRKNSTNLGFLLQSGQSLIEHSYKADSDLSPAGWEYAERLRAAVIARRKQVAEEKKARGEEWKDRKLVIWTSARRRAHHTAWPFVHSGYKVVQKPQMSEINPGVWDGLSPEEAKAMYPDEWERFLSDPYAHRAPRAESYHDLSVRLEPVIFELERHQEDLLIIGHASVIRCLLAYLVGLPPSEVPAVEIARGDLVEVVPASYGVLSRAFSFWSGEGRGDASGANLYENFAEATVGKVNDMNNVLPRAAEDLREKAEAEEEEERAAAAREAEAGGEAAPEGGAKLGRSMSFLKI